MAESELMDCADLIEVIAEETSLGRDCDHAKEQFRAQLIRVIDERVAIALEKRWPVTVATAPVEVAGVVYRTREDGAQGMYDPRK